jgi:hypothetical protein
LAAVAGARERLRGGLRERFAGYPEKEAQNADEMAPYFGAAFFLTADTRRHP